MLLLVFYELGLTMRYHSAYNSFLPDRFFSGFKFCAAPVRRVARGKALPNLHPFVFGVALGLALALSAFPAAAMKNVDDFLFNPAAELRQCTATSDCHLVYDPCGFPHTVNNIYVATYRQIAAKSVNLKNCSANAPSTANDKPVPPFSTLCEDNFCVLKSLPLK